MYEKTLLVWVIFEFVQDSTKASLQRVLRTKNMGSGVLMKILIVKRIPALKENVGKSDNAFWNNIGDQLRTLFCQNLTLTKFCEQKVKKQFFPL